MASALGVGTGTLVHIAAAAAGLSALIASSATAFGALRYVGAAYLVFLGIRTLRGEPAAAPESAPVAGGSLRRAYLEGALVNVFNAKVGLFFVAFLPQFVDPSRGGAAAQILVLGAVFFVTALAQCAAPPAHDHGRDVPRARRRGGCLTPCPSPTLTGGAATMHACGASTSPTRASPTTPPTPTASAAACSDPGPSWTRGRPARASTSCRRGRRCARITTSTARRSGCS